MARFVKYTVVARTLAPVIRHTNWLNRRAAPPRLLNYSADGDFIQQGDELVTAISRHATLSPGLRLLDIGCGIGRLATALHRNRPGIAYHGFDTVEYGILWCRKAIPLDDGYRFAHADIYNSFYNQRGRIAPTEYVFPYPDESIDPTVAISVFTHLLEAETKAYFAQAMRVLAKGGHAYFTTFLTPDAALETADFSFRHRIGAAAIERSEEPELAVSYSRAFWEDLALANGVHLKTVARGSWTGAATLPDYQDCLIFEKPT